MAHLLRGQGLRETGRARSNVYFPAGREHDGSLGCQQPESEGLLQVQFDGGGGMAQVTDGDVLADIQFEIAAAGRQHDATFDGWGPDDLAVDKTLNMLKDRIAFVAPAADGRVRRCTQQQTCRGH